MRFEISHPADDNEKKEYLLYIYMTIAAALGAEQCRDPAADDFPDFSRTSGAARRNRPTRANILRYIYTRHSRTRDIQIL